MEPHLSDTHPEIEALQIRLLRETPDWRKLEMLADLNEAARILALTGLRERYPQATEAEIQRRLADLLLGEEMTLKVYGEYQDEE